MQYFNRNGSYLQRKKMYVDRPFHNLNSKVELEWSQNLSTQQKQRKIHKQVEEHESIKNIYNDIIERRLQLKKNEDKSTFRAIPNELTLQRDRDMLSNQLHHFNESKGSTAIKYSYKIHTNREDKLVGWQDKLLNRYIASNLPLLQPIQYKSNVTNPIECQQDSLNHNAIRNHQSYAELSYGNKCPGPFNKITMPDKLEYFLRERAKPEKIRPINISLSLSKNHKNG